MSVSRKAEKRCHRCFKAALYGGNASGGVDSEEDDIAPCNPEQSSAWLEERKQRLAELQDIACRFLKTRDVTLLSEFVSTRPNREVNQQEPITGPVALFDHTGFLMDGKKGDFDAQEMLDLHNQDVKLFFPNVQIREVKTTSGGVVLAYVGVDQNTFAAIKELRHQQRVATLDIKHGAGHLALKTAEYHNTVVDIPCGSAVTPPPVPQRAGAETRLMR